MSWIEWFKYFEQLVYPNCCCVCGDLLVQSEKVICTDCLMNMPFTNYHLQDNNLLVQRFATTSQLRQASALFFYEKRSRYQNIFYQLKYNDRKDIGHYFGRLSALELQKSGWFEDMDYIVPVPLHPKREKKRGYNQSVIIAQGMESVCHVPIEKDTLIRVVETVTQTHKNVYERWDNTQGIFKLQNNTTLKGKNILIIDDVLTTGSTLKACIQAIHEEHPAQISLFTLACV